MNYQRREQFRISRLAPRHGLRGARFDDDTSVIFDVGISSEKKDEHQTKLVQPGLETRSGESLHGSNRTVVLQTDHAFEVSSIVGRAGNFRLVTVDGFPTTIATLHFGPGPKAREVFELYAAGAGTDLSIGFVPLGSRAPTEEEKAIGVMEEAPTMKPEELAEAIAQVDLASIPREALRQLAAVLAAKLVEATTQIVLLGGETGTQTSVLTVRQVAEELRLPRGAVYELCRTRELRSFRIGKHVRIRRAALDDYLKRVDGQLYSVYTGSREGKRAARRPRKSRTDAAAAR